MGKWAQEDEGFQTEPSGPFDRTRNERILRKVSEEDNTASKTLSWSLVVQAYQERRISPAR